MLNGEAAAKTRFRTEPLRNKRRWLLAMQQYERVLYAASPLPSLRSNCCYQYQLVWLDEHLLCCGLYLQPPVPVQAGKNLLPTGHR